MTKKVDRELDLIERLEQENRELKSIKRSLEKRVKKLSRGYRKFLDADPLEEDNKEVQIQTKMCYDCKVGEYKLHIIANRRWRACTNCDKRGKVEILP